MLTRNLAVVIAALAPLGACTPTTPNTQTRAYEASTVLVGRVETGSQVDGAIVVGAYTRVGGRWQIAHQTLLHEHGAYELIVPRGDHVLFAFADRNGNGLFDAGEPAARYDGGRTVAVTQDGMVGGLDMVLGQESVEVPRLLAASRQSTPSERRSTSTRPRSRPSAAARATGSRWTSSARRAETSTSPSPTTRGARRCCSCTAPSARRRTGATRSPSSTAAATGPGSSSIRRA